ncbi:MAG: hypothetical protein OHK0048_24460 [Rhodoferax sp.]
MYQGSLWLDFENDHEEAHFSAEISRCIINNNEIIFQFTGIDEGSRYSGSCRLSKNGEKYYGVGIFKYEGGDEISSTVEVSLDKDGPEILLHGTWKDEGDKESYDLEAVLSLGV